MSEVTLHGQPVKIGYKVWTVNKGDCIVECVDNSDLPIKAGGCWFSSDGRLRVEDKHASLFWQPIDQAAIEAAKLKPKEPEYSYVWYSPFLDQVSTRMTQKKWDETYILALKDLGEWVIIEESKREVKS